MSADAKVQLGMSANAKVRLGMSEDAKVWQGMSEDAKVQVSRKCFEKQSLFSAPPQKIEIDLLQATFFFLFYNES